LMLAHPPRQPRASLDDILSTLDVPLILQIKRRYLNPWHDRQVVDRIAALNLPHMTVSSFWPSTLTYAKRRYPKLRTAFITWWANYDLLFSRRLGATEYHVWHRSLRPHTVTRAAQRGVSIIVFTVPYTDQRLAGLRSRGAAGVITDQISRWARALAASQ